jgi:hypothetical protein
MILNSGCYSIVKDNTLIVQGVGLDVTFYPLFSIRGGYYKYTILVNNDTENINNKTIIIK